MCRSEPAPLEEPELAPPLGIEGEDLRDYGDAQLEAYRAVLLADEGGLYAFCDLIFGYHDLRPEIHGRLCNLVGHWKRSGDPDPKAIDRLMVQIPREFFKTSCFTRANALWQVCRGFYAGRDDAVLIVNEKLENTAKWIRAIRDVVQSSQAFQVLFADLLPPGIAKGDKRTLPRWWKWSDTELLFQRSAAGIPEASITGFGITAATTGGHWPTIIKDDLISVEAARSSAVMDYAKAWFDTSLYLERPAMGGRDLIVCTPWTYDDLYSYVLEKHDYQIYRRSVLEAGVSIWPEKFPTQKLLAQQRRDPFNFSSQMMCTPRAGREQSFDLEWLHWGSVVEDEFRIERDHYDPALSVVEGERAPRAVALEHMTKVVLFDPAPSEERDRNKERNARNALLVEGLDAWGRRYLLEAWADRLDPLDVLAQVMALCGKWGTNLVAIEEEIFSKLYRPMLLLYNRLHHKDTHIRFIRLENKRRDKDTRITSMIPKAREGIYFVNRTGCEKWLQEYFEYPYSATRDLLDAWAYDGCLHKPETASELLSRRVATARRVSPSSGRDIITGY